MARFRLTAAGLAVAVGIASAQGPCNPTKSSCPPLPGLTQGFSTDFTTSASIPSDWTIADGASTLLSLGQKGLEFRLNSGTDAPYIWTKDYIHYGKFTVTLQSSPGIGVISSAVLMSDTLDEIDWEWSGNDFNYKVPTVQTNYFGKGITGNWDRGTQPAVAKNMTSNYMTYTIDWTPESIVWMIDGKTIRTVYAKDGDDGQYQYPQTPSRFHLGVWDAGREGSPWYTVLWAGGNTDLKGFPYSMFVKSVEVVPYKSCSQYHYTDTSGSSGSVACLNVTSSTSSTATDSTPISPADASNTGSSGSPVVCSAPPENTQPGTSAGCARYYNVKAGDTCESIAKTSNIDVEDLLAWNPQADENCWNLWANYAICVSTPGECDDAAMPDGSSTITDTSTTTDASSMTDDPPATDASSPSETTSMTTATIRYTSTITEMQCATTITSCPVASQTVPVITTTVAEYTTICPVSLVESISSEAEESDLPIGATPLPGDDTAPPYASPTDVPDEDANDGEQDDADDDEDEDDEAPSFNSAAPAESSAPGDDDPQDDGDSEDDDEETPSSSAAPVETSVPEDDNDSQDEDDSEDADENPTNSAAPEETAPTTPENGDDEDDEDDLPNAETPASGTPTATATTGDDGSSDDDEDDSTSVTPAEETPAPSEEDAGDDGGLGEESTSSMPAQETPAPDDEEDLDDEDNEGDVPAQEGDASTPEADTTTSESRTVSSSPSSTSTAPTTSSSTAASCLPAAASIVCPSCDGQAYSVGNGRSFQITCDVDYLGGDLKYIDCGYDKNTKEAYARECASTTGCKAFSVVGFNCYLKKTLGSPKAYSGCVGGKLVDEPVCSQPPITNAEVPSTSSTASSASPSSTKTSSAFSTKATPTTVPTAGCFTYLDCYNEIPGRALKAKSFDNKNLTNEACADFCQGYKYFATEYSTECYCGYALVAGSSKVTDGRCNMPCAADGSQVCGGANGLSVYENTTCSTSLGYGLSSPMLSSSSSALDQGPTSTFSSSMATSSAPTTPADYESEDDDASEEDTSEDDTSGEDDTSDSDNAPDEVDDSSDDDSSNEKKRDESRTRQYAPRGRKRGILSRWFA